MSRTELQHVRDWLKALGSLCAGSTSAVDANAKITAYAPLLAADFSQAAFSRASLAVVAKKCKFFPTYGELHEFLTSWAKETRPPIANALPDPKFRSHGEYREIAEQSWRDITAAEVRAKIVEIQRAGAGSAAFARILAHAVATHAPQHAGLLPPEWIAP